MDIEDGDRVSSFHGSDGTFHKREEVERGSESSNEGVLLLNDNQAAG